MMISLPYNTIILYNIVLIIIFVVFNLLWALRIYKKAKNVIDEMQGISLNYLKVNTLKQEEKLNTTTPPDADE